MTVDDLLERLTLDEKIALLHEHRPPIERLGLTRPHTAQEALHGMAWRGEATVFPQAIGLASTWNPALHERVAAAVATEIRAAYHSGRDDIGLNTWSPVVDLLRDPRAGRNEEGYSEDPYLTGVLATAYCRGLSGDDPNVWATAPTLKHFLAYNNEERRTTTSSDVRPRLLREYYLRPFEPAIRSGAAKAVMLSYNLVNGRPAHVSPYMAGVLRTWAPDLLVVSDAFGPSNLVNDQEYFTTHEEAHAAALRIGLDGFTDQHGDPSFTTSTVRNALDRGLLDESTIDQAVRRILLVQQGLGGLEPPDEVPYARLGADRIGCADHVELARSAVRESIVLLRNDGLLPLDPTHTSSVAVIGPLADLCLEDWYSGTLPYQITPLDGIRERVAATSYAEGVDRVRLGTAGQTWELAVLDWGDSLVALRANNGKFLTRKDDGGLVADADQPHGWVVQETFRFVGPTNAPHTLRHVASDATWPIIEFERIVDGRAEAVDVAGNADVAVVVVGNHPMVGAREAADRPGIDLPAAQTKLVRAVANANPRTILVVESGYPYGLRREAALVPALLWLSHGGQETGHGLADVLFGTTSPSGRLTQTWHGSTSDLDGTSENGIGGIEDYDIIESGRTYLYDRREPLFPFGHGLSYSKFRYDAAHVDEQRAASMRITNTGTVFAAEVVQCYVRRTSPSRVHYPRQRLVGFERVELAPGESTTVRVGLDDDAFAHWDVRQHRFVVESGSYEVRFGASSADLRTTVSLDLDGETLPPRDPYRPISAVDFDRQHGVRLIPLTPLDGDAVLATDGSWIAFYDVEFDADTTGLIAWVGGTGEVTIRIDAADGPVIGHAAVDESTGWTRIRTAIVVPPDRHDVYLTVAGTVRLAEFAFEARSTSTLPTDL